VNPWAICQCFKSISIYRGIKCYSLQPPSNRCDCVNCFCKVFNNYRQAGSQSCQSTVCLPSVSLFICNLINQTAKLVLCQRWWWRRNWESRRNCLTGRNCRWPNDCDCDCDCDWECECDCDLANGLCPTLIVPSVACSLPAIDFMWKLLIFMTFWLPQVASQFFGARQLEFICRCAYFNEALKCDSNA